MADRMSIQRPVAFPVVDKGYAREAVDQVMNDLAERLGRTEHLVHELRQSLELSEGERLALRRSIDSVNQGLTQIARDAEAEASERRDLAESAARQIISSAQVQAAEIIADARAHAATVLGDERARLERDTDALVTTRVAVASERLELEERRTRLRAEFGALARLIADLQPDGPSELPGLASILRGEISVESVPAPDAGPETPVQRPEPVEPAEVVAEVVEEPEREPEVVAVAVVVEEPEREPEVVAVVVEEPEREPEVVALVEEPEAALGPALEWSRREPAPPPSDRPTEAGPVIDDDDPALDEAFDAYFSETIEHEPSRAWMLG